LWLCSNRLPSWTKNYRLSGDVDSECVECNTSSLLRCSRPIVYVDMCYKRAIGVVAACRWDGGRAERRRRRGEILPKPPTCPTCSQLFCDTLRIYLSHYAPNLRWTQTAPGTASPSWGYVSWCSQVFSVLSLHRSCKSQPEKRWAQWTAEPKRQAQGRARGEEDTERKKSATTTTASTCSQPACEEVDTATRIQFRRRGDNRLGQCHR
jgi:hypothetical protein